MPPIVPILAIGGVMALIAFLAGGGDAHASTSTPRLPPKPDDKPDDTPPEYQSCGVADRKYVENVLLAMSKDTARLYDLSKAHGLCLHCRWKVEADAIALKIKEVRKKDAEAKSTGIVKVENVKASTSDYVCGTIAGRGYACRPKSVVWKAKTKKLQKALNVAAKAIGQTGIKLKTDGSIGTATADAYIKVFRGLKANILKELPPRPEIMSANLDEIIAETLDIIKQKTGKAAVLGHHNGIHPPPIPGIREQAWNEFVLCIRGRGNRKGVGPFRTLPDRAKTLGVTVFPTTLRDQYNLFVADMKKRIEEIVSSGLGGYVGTDIAGHEVTLSGILALINQAGAAGAKSWLDNAGDRSKFPNTTAAFAECNGLF